jgi:hypothetical protein
MANPQSESERNYYEALTSEAAKEAVKAAEGPKKESAESVIKKILDRESIFQDKIDRFTRDVLKKADDLKSKAKDEREARIVQKYEGEVKVAGGKVRPAGIQENFRFRVRTGNIYRRIVGHGVDADKLNELMQDVQRIEDQMERNKIELAQLKAAREATSTIIGSERLGIEYGFTKGSLVKQIYAAKYKARGWRAFFTSETTLYDSYAAARDLKARHDLEYKTEGKAKIAALEKEAKELATKKQMLDAALQRVESMRSDGRAIFESTFGNELNVLVEGRETLGEEEFVKRIAEMRAKTEKFGKEAGFVGMDFFLKESLKKRDIDLAMFAKPGEYTQPQTAVEKGRERVRLGKWYEEVFLKKPAEGEISALIDSLRKDNPEFLKIFGEKKEPDKKADMILQFLFTGECPKGRTLLVSGRRAALNPENIVKFVKIADEAAKKAGSEDAIKKMLEDFANNRDESAGDFEWSNEAVRTGKLKPEELAKERFDKLNPLWERLTGQKFKDHDAANRVFEAMISKYGAEASVYVDKLMALPREKTDFIRFFYTGKYGNVTFTKMEGLLYDRGNPADFAQLFERTRRFFEETRPTPAEMKQMCEKLRKKARGEKEEDGSERSFKQLPQLLKENEKLLINMLAKIRQPEKKKKGKKKEAKVSQSNVTINLSGGKPAQTQKDLNAN